MKKIMVLSFILCAFSGLHGRNKILASENFEQPNPLRRRVRMIPQMMKSLFMFSIQHADIQVLQRCLALHPSLIFQEYMNSDGTPTTVLNAFTQAVQQDNYFVVCEQQDDGSMAVQYRSKEGNEDARFAQYVTILDILLAYGLEYDDQEDMRAVAALRDASGNSIYHIALLQNKGNRLFYMELIDKDLIPADLQNAAGDTPVHIHLRSISHSNELIDSLLLDKQYDFSKVGSTGNTILHELLLSKLDDDTISQILDEAASLLPINKKNEQKETASHIAARRGLFRSLKRLSRFGADLNVVNNEGQNVAHLFFEKGLSEVEVPQFSRCEIQLKGLWFFWESRVNLFVADNNGKVPIFPVIHSLFNESIKDFDDGEFGIFINFFNTLSQKQLDQVLDTVLSDGKSCRETIMGSDCSEVVAYLLYRGVSIE